MQRKSQQFERCPLLLRPGLQRTRERWRKTSLFSGSSEARWLARRRQKKVKKIPIDIIWDLKRDMTIEYCCIVELLSMVLFYIHFIFSNVSCEMGLVWHQSSLAFKSCSFKEYTVWMLLSVNSHWHPVKACEKDKLQYGTGADETNINKHLCQECRDVKITVLIFLPLLYPQRHYCFERTASSVVRAYLNTYSL